MLNFFFFLSALNQKIHLRKRAIIIFVFVFQTGSTDAQLYDLFHYSAADGLLQSTVNAIHQDHQGYIWAATNGGLSRFDGQQFTNYTPSNGLKKTAVSSLCEDLSGNLWMTYNSTDSIITRYDQSGFKTFSLPVLVKARRLFCDSKGDLWLCTTNQGALRIKLSGRNENLEVKLFQAADGLSDQVFSVDEDDHGNLWFATELGIKKFNLATNIFEKFRPNGLPFVTYTSVVYGRNGVLFVGTDGYGIYKADTKTGAASKVHYDRNNAVAHSIIRNLALDRSGVVWASTSGQGVISISTDSVFQLTTMNGLQSDRVNCVYQDREGNFWIGLQDFGIDYFRGTRFQSYTEKEGLPNKLINAICKDNSGRLWLGTNEGIGIFDPFFKTFKNITLNSVLASNRVFSIVSTPDNHIVAGTFGGGLAIIDPQNLQIKSTFYLNNDFDYVNCLHSDSPDNIYVGTILGAFIYHPKTGSWNSINKLARKNVNFILREKNGSLLYGLRDGGYYLGRADSVVRIRNDNGREETMPTIMLNDPSGKVWIGTQGEGVYLWDGTLRKKIGTDEGLSSNLISSLYYQDSTLWIGTNRGLSKYDIPTNKIINFGDQYGGYSASEFRSSSIVIDNQNVLWVGTLYGLVGISTQELKKTTPALPVHVGGYNVFNTFLHSDSIVKEFSYWENEFTFRYYTLYFDNPKALHYQTFLEGTNKNWISAGRETSVNYSGLVPGDYQFRVRGSIDGINWTEAPEIVKFTLLPPFWKRKDLLFYAFCFVLALGILFHRKRTAYLLRRQRNQSIAERSMIQMEMKALRSQMNPHFIFNSLQSIQNFLLEKNTEDANIYLLKFAKLIRIVLENSQHQEVALESDLNALELYMQLESLRMKYPFKYSINIDNNIDPEIITIPPLTLQPFVENSIWHGVFHLDCVGHIDIHIRKENNCLIFTVEDNGVGRNISKSKEPSFLKKKESLGMKLTEERLKMISKLRNINAYMKVTDLYDSANQPVGTRVDVTIPEAT